MKRIRTAMILAITSLTGFAQQGKLELFDQSALKVSDVRVNTVESGFGATLVGDTLFFTSKKSGDNKMNANKRKQPKFYGIFKAGVDQNGHLTGGRKSVGEFSTSHHDGMVSSWCAKTEELFLTQTNEPQLRYDLFPEEYNGLKISIAKKTGPKWEVVEEFPFNNTDYSVAHPAINETGDTLVFASDMPGGFGEADLYLSVRKNGKWETPVNLGSHVNTSSREEFPFLIRITNGGTHLVFSSDRSGGKGGMDLYYTQLNNSNTPIMPFDGPINSEYDDFALSFFPEKGAGYFSSNRKGTGDDDIYRFTFDNPPNFMQGVYGHSLPCIPVGAPSGSEGHRKEVGQKAGCQGLINVPSFKNKLYIVY